MKLKRAFLLTFLLYHQLSLAQLTSNDCRDKDTLAKELTPFYDELKGSSWVSTEDDSDDFDAGDWGRKGYCPRCCRETFTIKRTVTFDKDTNNPLYYITGTWVRDTTNIKVTLSDEGEYKENNGISFQCSEASKDYSSKSIVSASFKYYQCNVVFELKLDSIDDVGRPNYYATELVNHNLLVVHMDGSKFIKFTKQ